VCAWLSVALRAPRSGTSASPGLGYARYPVLSGREPLEMRWSPTAEAGQQLGPVLAGRHLDIVLPMPDGPFQGGHSSTPLFLLPHPHAPAAPLQVTTIGSTVPYAMAGPSPVPWSRTE